MSGVKDFDTERPARDDALFPELLGWSPVSARHADGEPDADGAVRRGEDGRIHPL